MKTQHTLGPWQLTTVPFEIRNTDSAASIYGPQSINGGACLIADISRSAGDEQATANAQLIASAPDLLEALKSATNKSYQFGVTPYTDDLGNRWVKYEQRISEADYNKIHSTIAKAEKS